MNGSPTPVDGLRDLHLPTEPGWWPPAPGWWVLAMIAVAGITFLAVAGWKRRNKRRWQRAAFRELEAIESCCAGSHDAPEQLRALSKLLRRVAIQLAPGTRVAGLTGRAWLEHLDRLSNSQHYTHGPGRVFADMPYSPHAGAVGELDALLALVRKTIAAAPRHGEYSS